MNFKVGDWVEVRSKEEILRTLDARGQLDRMPFMPEMFQFCGQRFRINKSAHKTCDTVFPTRSRKISNTVHLGNRCDGSAHGGCEARCTLFWKEAWLKPANENHLSSSDSFSKRESGCSEVDLIRSTRAEGDMDDSNPTWSCQATRLPDYTDPLSPYNFWQYIQDLRSGNVGLSQWLRGLIYISYNNIVNAGVGLGRPLRWFYERFQKLRGGLPYPRWSGTIKKGQATPTGELNLREGEWVRIKSYQDILATLTEENKNRGLLFDGEMMPYCGQVYRVHKRVDQIINEQTGKMIRMKNPCIILENVVCKARYSECRMFCPRELYPYWREIWLERVSAPDEGRNEKETAPAALNLGGHQKESIAQAHR
jgi:hypothetical protein